MEPTRCGNHAERQCISQDVISVSELMHVESGHGVSRDTAPRDLLWGRVGFARSSGTHRYVIPLFTVCAVIQTLHMRRPGPLQGAISGGLQHQKTTNRSLLHRIPYSIIGHCRLMPPHIFRKMKYSIK